MKDESNYNALNVHQEARAEALHVARNVLVNTALFNKAVPEGRGIQDLLTLAEYIIGDKDEVSSTRVHRSVGWSFPIPEGALPGVFSALGDVLPDCDHPDCPIHGPRREAQDLNPEDAKSSFDGPEFLKNVDTVNEAAGGGSVQSDRNPFVDPHEIWNKQHGSHEPPVDFDNLEQTGMAEASDFEGGEADTAQDDKS